MFDEKDQNANNHNNENSGNFRENKDSFKKSVDNLEEKKNNLNIEDKKNLPEDIFADVDKIEDNTSNIESKEYSKKSQSSLRNKKFGKKTIILIIVIIIAIAALVFLLLKNLPQTNNTVYNNIPQDLGLSDLIEDQDENFVNIEDDYLLEEDLTINPLNIEEDIIINNKEVDISVLDSDSDGLTDYQEIEIWGTDPYNFDTDLDGYNDFDEIKSGFNPLGDGELE
jgi:hypothetical protein